MSLEQGKIVFKGLDSLRFFGAISVVIGHIELSRKDFGFENVMHLPYFHYTSGHIGVILFFVLSGFLITYLLLEEKQRTATIAFKKFFIRRALRIWPIYYLMVFFAFFGLPALLPDYPGRALAFGENSGAALMLFLLLIPNFTVFGTGAVPGAYHLGTIGVEEQFYWIWPLLVRWFRNAFLFLVLVFIGITLLPKTIDFVKIRVTQPGDEWRNLLDKTVEFLAYFKINCMAIGGMWAFALHKGKQQILKLAMHPVVEVVAWIAGFGSWIAGVHFSSFTDEYYGLIFGVIILNAAANSKPVLNLDIPFLRYLGKISYGIYVFHWVLIIITLYFIRTYSNLAGSGWEIQSLVIYPIVLGLTWLISHLSYYYYEQYFLRLKDKFAIVKSGS